jgi:hypothetical protein
MCNDLESTNALSVVSFQYSNNACGRAIDHANELCQIIQNTKESSGQNQVNIVGYSKGGLDARVYLDRIPLATMLRT